MLDAFICPLILILKSMLRYKCYHATLVDEEIKAQRDLNIYLWPHRWSISESEYKIQKCPISETIHVHNNIGFLVLQKIKGSSLSEVNLCVQLSQS